MRRVLFVAMAVTVLLALAVGPAYAAPPVPVQLDVADLSNADLTAGARCTSFNAEAPGNWGGEYGDGAVTAFPTDADPAGYCTFTGLSDKARRIQMRVLDGLADDSFEVYVKNPGGNWVLVFSYADQYATETWVTHQIRGFPHGKGQGSPVEIMIVPTGPQWSGFNTYGQLAVDYISIWNR